MITLVMAGTVVLTLLLLPVGCSKDAATDNQAQNSSAQPDLVVGAKKGNLAPNFNLKKIDGGNLELSSLKGKAVLIDFWDTWCPPCRRALPHLQEISDTYAGDLVVVGVAMGRDGEQK